MRVWRTVRRLLLRRLLTPLNLAFLGGVSMLVLLTASILVQLPPRTCHGPACTDAELAQRAHFTFGGAAWTADTANSAAKDAVIAKGLKTMGRGPVQAGRPTKTRTAARSHRTPKPDVPTATAAEAQEITPERWAELAQQPDTKDEALSKADLIAAVPINTQRLVLAAATRSWRRGMRAFFASDLPVGEALRTEGAAYGEVYSVFPDDVKQRSKWPGDTRAAITPFLAAKALGADSFKWLLSGDDDTVFFTDNVIKLLAPLDHNLPYILSDALWFYNHSSPDFVHFHPHPMAPRCLPCDHDDPTADGSKAPFAAPRGCPCTPALLCESDDGHRFNKTTCELLSNGKLYGVGRFFNIHGGSGVILSSGLMRQIPYKTFRQCLKKLPGRALGGDAMFSRCLWQLGFATTDPGYGFTRPHIQVFDMGPGRTQDLRKLLHAFEGGRCDVQCKDQLDHLVSIHVRARQFGSFEAAAEGVRAVSIAVQRYLDVPSQS